MLWPKYFNGQLVGEGKTSSVEVLDVDGQLLEEISERFGPLGVDGILALVGCQDAVGVHEGSLTLFLGGRSRGLLHSHPDEGVDSVGDRTQMITMLRLALLAFVFGNGTNRSRQASNQR